MLTDRVRRAEAESPRYNARHGRLHIAEPSEMSTARTSLGELLRDARLRAGLTQEELALRSGLGVRTIGDLERDHISRPHRRTVDMLVQALGLGEEEHQALRAVARGPRPGAASARRRPPRPSQLWGLPPDLDDFVGRRGELQRLLDRIAGGSPGHRGPTLITGGPGTGKTSLAVRAGYRLADQFPDGQVFVDLHGLDPRRRTSVEEALGILLRNLGVPEADIPLSVEHRTGLLRALTRERSMLFVLDDAADEAQVRPLLPASGAARLIITSRRTLAGLEVGARIPLGSLEPDESVTMLGLIAGWDRVEAERDEALEVCRLCAYLPLMLRIVGNRLAVRPQWTVSMLIEGLRDERSRLSRLVAGDLSARRAIELSYGQLSQSAQRLFRRLSMVPGGVASISVAALLIESDRQSAEDVLEELVDYNLLAATSSAGRYRLPDPPRLLARELLGAQERYVPLMALLRFTALQGRHAFNPSASAAAPALPSSDSSNG